MLENIDLQVILDNLPVFIFWKDRESNFRGSNKAFAELGGFEDPFDVVGKSDYDMPWSKEESDFFRKVDREVMNSEEPQLGIEEPLTREDGDVSWLSTNKIPIKDKNGEVTGVLGTFEDITLKKKLQLRLTEQNESLKKLNRKLQLKNEQLEQFTYIATHDLQEPITNIHIITDYLLRSHADHLDEKGKQSLEYLMKASDRMRGLVSSLMNYARIGMTQEKVEVNCKDLIDDVVSDLDFVIKEKQASIHIGELPLVKAYKPEVRSLFQNLISNALKFSKQNEPPVISIVYELDSDFHVFRVGDNGIGIEEKNLVKVFQVFKRIHTQDEYAGTGIGLAHCKKIVELHEGNIFAESTFGEGSNFYFTLKK